ncbi:MAG: HAD family hydrolase [Sphingomonas sp.]|uniref:HAD family hydrolase n=1 Tax=Sphingomonas sp. TaxID=28214 RepID=UPI00121CA2F4|nr:HAD family hydrolase [Sphingomonas sp.]THD36047.1 MAG: HAD family hydrolase [Sphingomonas sp.]
MTRPLLICDCDEVLLHMVRHFGVWLRERHDVSFAPDGGDFANSMTRADGSPVEREAMWGMLNEFFPAEMERQTLVPGAAEALAALSETADIVILTNLGDHCRDHRIAQLAKHGINHRVETNQGGKGGPVAALVAEYGDPVTVFVDDLAHHHESVARHAPEVHRLQLIAEPAMAPTVPPAPFAHARIDDWADARDWIIQRFSAKGPAENVQGVSA